MASPKWGRSRLVEPDRIQTHDVKDAEISGGVVALDVIVPNVVEPFPGDRQLRRILLHDAFGLTDQRQALAGVHLAVDLPSQHLEFGVLPERVVLRTVFAVPGVEVIGWSEQGAYDSPNRQVVVAVLDVVEPDRLDDGAQ